LGKLGFSVLLQNVIIFKSVPIYIIVSINHNKGEGKFGSASPFLGLANRYEVRALHKRKTKMPLNEVWFSCDVPSAVSVVKELKCCFQKKILKGWRARALAEKILLLQVGMA